MKQKTRPLSLRNSAEAILTNMLWKAIWELLAGAFGWACIVAFWCLFGDPSLGGVVLVVALGLLVHGIILIAAHPSRSITLDEWDELLKRGISEQPGYKELSFSLKETGHIRVFQLKAVVREWGLSWELLPN